MIDIPARWSRNCALLGLVLILLSLYAPNDPGFIKVIGFGLKAVCMIGILLTACALLLAAVTTWRLRRNYSHKDLLSILIGGVVSVIVSVLLLYPLYSAKY
jgi:hypothetical protein